MRDSEGRRRGISRRRSTVRGYAAAGAALLAATALAGCSGGSSAGNAIGAAGKTTVTYAQGVGVTPNWIFPIIPGQNYSVANTGAFQGLMFRPLYAIGKDGQYVLNDSLSLADEPAYSNNNTTVVVNLKKYTWSDGKPVTTRDVDFFLRLLVAQKTDFAKYTPGQFPDNVKSWSADSPTQLTFQLTGPVNPQWFTYNELSQITPMPQHAWDKTSADGAVGDHDQTADGAKQVYTYLVSQAKDVSSYATNPLWQVVDGPWKLKTFDTAGQIDFVPNPNYAGPSNHQLTGFSEKPFTSATALQNSLLSGGGVDVGYLPTAALPAKTRIEGAGYRLDPISNFSINYIQFNFNNPQTGPLYQQLYIRQALQSAVNQPLYIAKAMGGYGYPNYGPVPVEPKNPFYSASEKDNSYPFDTAHAVDLLKSHGWTVSPSGGSTCTNPGTGADQCGAGIAQGAKLAFNLQYVSGDSPADLMMQQFKTDAAAAGITVNLSTAPFNTVFGAAAKCTAAEASCGWQALYYEGWGYGGAVPTGEGLFTSSAGSNFGSYHDPKADELIQQTLTGGSSQALVDYQDYLAQQLPVIWLPGGQNLTLVAKHLQGVDLQSPSLPLTPEQWSFTR
ncbi:peptide ABC transporter substrate-binding protein [Catenulispora yoronensis]|uniref:peptide ABC transporter substrate-binding protein n=1 Tax=Catenulispora yoronensis TaxID=450799 RepID=UPI0031D63425